MTRFLCSPPLPASRTLQRVSVSSLALVVGLLVASSGCSFGSEAAFIGGATRDECENELPVCNATAGCKLTEELGYIDGQFPGFRSFIVPTEGAAVIRVKIYWRTQLAPGADTEIVWFEPACVDSVRYESGGIDIFADTGDDGIFFQDGKVFRGGDHLIEIRSDATGEYIIRPEVFTEAEYEAEEQRLRGIGL
jgi:hypothetical protein